MALAKNLVPQKSPYLRLFLGFEAQNGRRVIPVPQKAPFVRL
jgi:hypothetical protein